MLDAQRAKLRSIADFSESAMATCDIPSSFSLAAVDVCNSSYSED
jgi:hypothetical protein